MVNVSPSQSDGYSMSGEEWISITIGLLLAAWILVVLVVRMLRRPRWQALRTGLKNIVDALFGIG